MKKTTPHNDGIPGLSPGVEMLGKLSPYVRHCGDSRRTAWVIERRCLLDYLLVYIASGKGRFDVGEGSWEAGEHDLFWIPPGMEHHMEGYGPSMRCVYAHFDLIYRPEVSHWDFSIPAGMCDPGELRPLMHPPVNIPPVAALSGRITSFTSRQVGELLKRVVYEAGRAQGCAPLVMSGLMMEILGLILRGRAESRDEEHEHVMGLEAAADYALQHCHEEISVEEMAAAAGLSESYFRTLFKRVFGVSPREFIRRARMSRARELMHSTAMTFSEIARMVGFSGVHAFSRAFKESEGLTPSDYRKFGRMATRSEARQTPRRELKSGN